MSEKNTIYICNYGQTGIPVCVDPSHVHCKLKSMKSKKCDFRKVINYAYYEELKQQIQALSEQVKAKDIEIKEAQEYIKQSNLRNNQSVYRHAKELYDLEHEIKDKDERIEALQAVLKEVKQGIINTAED